MTGLCLAAGLLMVPLGDTVTLRWTHSIGKIAWEEDYRLEQGALRLTEARVRGTGAGMEPPADAVFSDGAWHYTPKLAPLPRVALRHSPYTAQYEFCVETACRMATDLLPGLPAEAVLDFAPCPSPAGS